MTLAVGKETTRVYKGRGGEEGDMNYTYAVLIMLTMVYLEREEYHRVKRLMSHVINEYWHEVGSVVARSCPSRTY